MAKRLLTYALNSHGNIVFIDDVANGLNCECICPCCKEKLMAKNGGTKKIHHFAHVSEMECKGAYESMLHLLAKERIRKAFLEKDDFKIEYIYRSYCPNVHTCRYNCGYNRYKRCFISSLKSFNLKEYYDSCEEEIPYDTIRRRSDLKIFSSKNPNLKPIYIEFFVTHGSDEEKLHSGEKIIEVKIESEDDIDKIANEGFIQREQHITREEYIDDENMVQDISFYGFKDSDYNAKISQEIEFTRHILFPSGKSLCYEDYSQCNHIAKARRNSLFEICFLTPVELDICKTAKYQGYKRFGIKNCILCRNYVERYSGMGMICRLYKHLGISNIEQLDTARAKECRCFSINEEEMKEELNEYESLSPESYTEM